LKSSLIGSRLVRSHLLLRISACVALLTLGAGFAAGQQTFFGEDLNTTNDPGTGADDPVRIAHPNADTARNSFFAQLTGVSTASFEAQAAGAVPPIVLAFGADTATLTGAGVVQSVPSDTFNGTYPITGNQFYLLQLASGSSAFTVTFNSPQAAFGFYATDIGDGFGQLTVTLNHSGGGSTALVVPSTAGAGSGSVLYFGVINAANPFSSVTLTNDSTSGDGFGFDDLTIGPASQVVGVTPTPTLTAAAPTATPTVTLTAAPPTATPTLVAGAAPAVPTLSGTALVLLTLALAGVAIFVLARDA
jgi:hypothetical protein